MKAEKKIMQQCLEVLQLAEILDNYRYRNRFTNHIGQS